MTYRAKYLYTPKYDKDMRRGYVGTVFIMHDTAGKLHLSYCDYCHDHVDPSEAEAHSMVHVLSEAP